MIQSLNPQIIWHLHLITWVIHICWIRCMRLDLILIITDGMWFSTLRKKKLTELKYQTSVLLIHHSFQFIRYRLKEMRLNRVSCLCLRNMEVLWLIMIWALSNIMEWLSLAFSHLHRKLKRSLRKCRRELNITKYQSQCPKKFIMISNLFRNISQYLKSLNLTSNLILETNSTQKSRKKNQFSRINSLNNTPQSSTNLSQIKNQYGWTKLMTGLTMRKENNFEELSKSRLKDFENLEKDPQKRWDRKRNVKQLAKEL